jgi:hypothetical protein
MKPEAAYFITGNGVRAALFFVQMIDAAQLPAFSEPAFLAKVDATPAIEASVKKYHKALR